MVNRLDNLRFHCNIIRQRDDIINEFYFELAKENPKWQNKKVLSEVSEASGYTTRQLYRIIRGSNEN